MAKKQREKKQNGRRNSLLYTIVTCLLIVVSVVGACTVFFRVEFVSVEGNERYSEEQVLSVADVELGANLILTPGEQIAQRIYKGLPYVNHVDVQKRFPTTLKLVLTESVPVAVMSSGDGAEWVIDSQGKLLEKVDDTLALEYIDVEGLTLENPQQGQQAQVPQENGDQLAGLLKLLQAIESRGIVDKISEIDASSRTEVVFFYEDRLKVKILNNADFERKIRILEAIVATLGANERGTIDLKTDTPIASSDM